MMAVHAYVRERSVERVIRALHDAGCQDVFVLDARRVAQGLGPSAEDFSVELGQAYERMLKLELMATDVDAARWAEVIAAVARTGGLSGPGATGDGVVFVLPGATTIRISTGQRAGGPPGGSA